MVYHLLLPEPGFPMCRTRELGKINPPKSFPDKTFRIPDISLSRLRSPKKWLPILPFCHPMVL